MGKKGKKTLRKSLMKKTRGGSGLYKEKPLEKTKKSNPEFLINNTDLG